MNWEMLKGVVERIATFTIAWAVGRGYVPEALSADLIALVVLGATVAAGFYVNTQKSLVQAAASMPDVKRVVVDNPKLAENLDQPQAKVTTT